MFSAVLTTFVAQTSQTPSDTGDTTIALLLELISIQRAWANNTRVDGVASYSLPPPAPTPSPWINRSWFLSLIFSLLAAFGAVVVRQWLQVDAIAAVIIAGAYLSFRSTRATLPDRLSNVPSFGTTGASAWRTIRSTSLCRSSPCSYTSRCCYSSSASLSMCANPTGPCQMGSLRSPP